MKPIFTVTTITLFFLFNASCKKEEAKTPSADFEFIGNATAPCTVTFTQKCKDTKSYSWDFGNGQTSTLEKATCLYTKSGTYKVTLAATNDAGTTNITKDVLIMGKDPVADFDFAFTTRVPPATVQFTNMSTDYSTLTWNFGDGTTSYATNPSKIFSSVKTNTITLIATGNGKTVTKSKDFTTTKPVLAWIKGARLYDYPATKSNGSNWNSDGSYPNIYLKITDGSSTLLETGYLANQSKGDLPRSWSIPSSVQIDLTKTYTISIYAYHSLGSDDFMSGFTYDFLNTNSWPESLNLSLGDFSIMLTMEYL